ncbi:pancreatic adenocarcinoma up-regulated factor [Dasypus novemcinctus]|uniref:pancreatic adenocarcinoma up-regulated factor n=1 Tax=Dasypus novemcinctus TaxID=9361 RepID=UPI0003288702|nr:zymogen granule protein 16 homolog B [Dasypus novemcinctus]
MLPLLLLALAALAPPACRAQQIYGEGGGKYFSIAEDDNYDVSGIRVCTGLFGQIKSIQLKFGPAWSDRYGAWCEKAQEFTLRPNEHFESAYGFHGLFVRGLVLYTTDGRMAPFGTQSGRTFTAYPSQAGQVLTGVYGFHKPLGISGLGFQWNYPLEAPTSPGPASSPTPE